MNKCRKLISVFKLKNARLKQFFSEKWYVRSINNYLKYIGCDLIGKIKFFAYDAKLDLTDPSKIHIGNGTVITSKVLILVHDYSIECGLVSINKQDSTFESLFIKDVRIGNNCFIGQASIIKPGTEIGDNCIIGSGAVVSGKIPSNSVVIGNPCVVVADTREWAIKKYNQHNYVNGNKRK